MRARIPIAVAAWLLGAVTATCGSLLAISLLGDGFGIGGPPSQPLTVAAVNKALADARREQSPAPSASPSRPSLPSLPSRPARPRASKHSAAARPAPAQPGTTAGTLLGSPAGTVVASCGPAGVYLLSWSPAQGYGVDRVARGPATVASVVFDAGTRAVTMQVVCRGGTPVSSTSSGGDDDGGSSGGGDD